MIIILDRPKTPANVGSVFRSALAFGCKTIILVAPRWNLAKTPLHRLQTDPNHAIRYQDVIVVATLPEALSHVPANHSVVVVERALKGRTFLDTFEHPQECVYVFGPEDSGVSTKELIDMAYQVVEIRGSVPLAHSMQACLNLAMSVSIVLYDRAAKTLQCPSITTS